MYKKCLFLFSYLALACCGCAHMQLRKITGQQLRTTGDITQQQIMDNVAKIAGNENAWPDFSNFTEGGTQITDTGESNVGLTWNARTIIQEMFGIRGSRSQVERWTLKPTTDPARIRAMWAIYHYTIYGEVPIRDDYDAHVQLEKIFGPNWQQLVPPPGWFHTACEKECIEKTHCGCVIGHYCNVHAYVCPGHREDLQQLTYLIMHISSVTYGTPAAPIPFPTGIPGFPGEQRVDTQGSEEILPMGPAKEFNSFSPGVLLTPQ
jgi:hypothetical protein